jgi:manganese/iron transport system permease protein
MHAYVEVLLLAAPAGLLGTWVVLRGLAFHTHAVGTAAFPGLVVAGPWGVPAQLTALGAALAFAGGVERVGRRRGADAATGLGLVAALAVGAILAEDVYPSDVEVEALLFGSLDAISRGDLLLTAFAGAAAVALDAVLHRVWLRRAFDPGSEPAPWADRGLLVAIAAVVVLALEAAGALLVGLLLVLPAAAALQVASDLPRVRAIAVGLAAAEGVLAIALARELDVPPGAVLGLLGALVLGAAVAVAR